MACSPHPTRRPLAHATLAVAVLAVGSLVASAADAQISHGTFALQEISRFGTDNGGNSADLPFVAWLGDDIHTQVHVNNNGILSFGGFFPGFSNDSLASLANAADHALIAPFYADVDTVKVASNTGGQGMFGTGSVDGRNAFIATWDRVGRWNEQFDRLSTFEVLLIDRSDIDAGDFDIVFNYGDIEWTVANPGDEPARVGIAVPDGQAFEFDLFDALPEPEPDTELLLANALQSQPANDTPSTTADSIRLQVRGGVVQDPHAVPSPTALATGLIGLALACSRRRRSL